MIILILLSMLSSEAKADWLCTEVASQRRGNTIVTCGVAKVSDENLARLAALRNAKAEYKNICNDSADCRGHKVVIDPKRTECKKDKEGFYTCHRLVEYTITSDTEDKVEEFQMAEIEIPNCADECNPTTQEGCWFPGAMKKLRDGCK